MQMSGSFTLNGVAADVYAIQGGSVGERTTVQPNNITLVPTASQLSIKIVPDEYGVCVWSFMYISWTVTRNCTFASLFSHHNTCERTFMYIYPKHANRLFVFQIKCLFCTLSIWWRTSIFWPKHYTIVVTRNYLCDSGVIFSKIVVEGGANVPNIVTIHHVTVFRIEMRRVLHTTWHTMYVGV